MKKFNVSEPGTDNLVAFEPAIKPYDYINPPHYKTGSKEVIDMMIDCWGREAVMLHCEMTAFKYRMRLGSKPDQPIERDFEKAKWYEAKAKELKSLIETSKQIQEAIMWPDGIEEQKELIAKLKSECDHEYMLNADWSKSTCTKCGDKIKHDKNR